ncbi:hypothetical protein ACMHYB_05335 [Sorangium sp. So ce1128]
MSELRLHGTLTRKLAPLAPRRHDGRAVSPGVVELERRAEHLDPTVDRVPALLGPSGEGAAPELPARLPEGFAAKGLARGGASGGSSREAASRLPALLPVRHAG